MGHDLHFDTQAGIRDRITAQFGARVGSSTMEGLLNIIGVLGGYTATSMGTAFAPWLLWPAVLWNVVRQPEVRALLGRALPPGKS